MKALVLNAAAVLLLWPLAALSADPVKLDCTDCTVDPCTIAPERCKDQGGPITEPDDADSKKEEKSGE